MLTATATRSRFATPEATFDAGAAFGSRLAAGDAVLLTGGLGAGKTLFTKGIMQALGYDIDEVTSPSFTLVNLYPTEKFDVYHLDLWRLDAGSDVGFAVGLDDMIENEKGIVIVEWAERLGRTEFRGRTFRVEIDGDGDDERTVTIDEIKAGGQA